MLLITLSWCFTIFELPNYSFWRCVIDDAYVLFSSQSSDLFVISGIFVDSIGLILSTPSRVLTFCRFMINFAVKMAKHNLMDDYACIFNRCMSFEHILRLRSSPSLFIVAKACHPIEFIVFFIVVL